ncbi:uncharacterized protein Z520_09118 [Fonsecaea multimorphosa CBS 102226]|uniref:Uncharacterized protein n=1 Tax=Fonsecaea multimorphosa CBS 102226 TaxID=1442371 RepID=A0A0D2JPB4_9EURO|nr:uncharacterized protein Z520_09118 [Fonsecaea multimorphosa CBS 102226]KIX95202.1 hypothetical protein Z520_09118 [Fonsecaea multimorphosa CBS 102226]OAL20917.1 hypothetical protein AYO22_08545 [Fonsecaea multimorphosa]
MSFSRQYAEGMRIFGDGHALYKPEISESLQPGDVGYFDSTARWNPLASLSDPASLTLLNLQSPTEPLERAPSLKIAGWGPRTTESVKRNVLDGGVELTNAGLPVEASVKVEYLSDSGFGAILLTSSPITREGYYFDSPFRTWIKANSKALLEGPRGTDIAKYGIVVVTQTFSTKKAGITAWGRSGHGAYVGFSSGTLGVGSLQANCGWFTGNSASGWSVYGGEALEEEQVVFIAGLRYHKSRNPFANQLHESSEFTSGPFAHRSAESHEGDIILETIDDNQVLFEIQLIGQPLDRPDESDDENDDAD